MYVRIASYGRSVCSSQSSRRSPEKKNRDLTSTAAFKTAKSSPRWKGLGTTAEEDNDTLYYTASGKSHKKSVRTSETFKYVWCMMYIYTSMSTVVCVPVCTYTVLLLCHWLEKRMKWTV